MLRLPCFPPRSQKCQQWKWADGAHSPSILANQLLAIRAFLTARLCQMRYGSYALLVAVQTGLILTAMYGVFY